ERRRKFLRRHRHHPRRRRLHQGPAQVLRLQRGPQGHQPGRGAGRSGVPDRPLRLRQVHPAPLREPAGTAQPGQRPRGRLRGHGPGRGHRQNAPQGRHGVPAVQPVPAPGRQAQLLHRPDQGPQAFPGRGGQGVPAQPGARRPGTPRGPFPRPALRRAAAARGHRPRPQHGPGADALRRAHLRAGPRNRRRCPLRHAEPRQGGHDHAGGDPRNGLRPRGGGPRGVHGRRSCGGGGRGRAGHWCSHPATHQGVPAPRPRSDAHRPRGV
ncbi:ABC transporter, ATP-binding protein (cluster 3, basic aa/glutamine/opines), partial [Arthrobacter sp. DR-2P]